MIQIKQKEDCCGCAVCANVCPVHCITMQEDNEGFLYPSVNNSQCIKCGKCEKMCPVLQISGESDGQPKTYAVYHKNDEVKKQSSSGGVFSAFAEWILAHGGVVFGAAMTKDCKSLHHISVDRYDDLAQLRGSKYIQSSMESAFPEIEEQLQKGRLVLFTGTPCQAEALRRYLKQEYNNLYIMDIICHGVASPKLWRKYLQYRERNCGSEAEEVHFRNKRYGWRTFSLLIAFSNHKRSTKIFKEDLFGQAFLQNICLRPSCHACVFKKFNGESDITVGDFWGNAGRMKDDDTGISLVLIHSQKGLNLFSEVANQCEFMEIPPEAALKGNTVLYASVLANPKRAGLFSEIDSLPVDRLLKKYVNRKLPCKLRIKFALKKVGLL